MIDQEAPSDLADLENNLFPTTRITKTPPISGHVSSESLACPLVAWLKDCRSQLNVLTNKQKGETSQCATLCYQRTYARDKKV